MALALYRTYRPGSLAEVIGQEHVTEPLKRALAAGRTHHAYLFSGPRGCGKTSTARILARSLNCSHGPTADPCGECRSCLELAPNGPGSMDVVELDAATHRGIDDARELREKAVYAPAASRFKVYIIDEAHQLTNEAANALLKLVEEPPAHLRFIFATTEPDKIIPTIRSRTFHYGFRLVPARTLADHLAAVCRAEGVPAEQPALATVARAGAGSVRDSLSVLGQLLAGAGPEGLTYSDAISALGLTDTSLIDDFIAALAAGSAGDMFGIVDDVISAGYDPRRFLIDVLDRLRDLIILRADHAAADKGLVDVPNDSGQKLLTQAQSLGPAQLSRAADQVSLGLGQIKGATAPRLQLELLCARLALPDVGQDLSAVLALLDQLERTRPGGGAAPPATAAEPAPRERPQREDELASPPAGRPEPPAPPSAPVWRAAERPAAGGSEPSTRPTPATGPSAPSAPAAAAATSSGPRTSPPRRPDLRRDAAAGAATAPADGDVPRPVDSPGAARSPSRPPTAPDGPRVAGEKPDVTEAAGEHLSAPTGGSAPTPPPTQGGGDADLTRVRDSWSAILDRLASSSRVAWTAFHAASPVSCSNGALAVAVAEPGNVRAIAQRGHDERLRQAIIDVVSMDLTIDVLHDPQATTTGPARTGLEGASGGVAQVAGARSAPTSIEPDPMGPGRSGSLAAGPPASSPDLGPDPTAGAHPADVVRAAGARGPEAAVVDEPSPDDPDLESGTANGLALIARELGARAIDEIDNS